MMTAWSQRYRRIDSSLVEGARIEAWISASVADARWDDFLRSTPVGQFQQSSLWSEFKCGEGWSHHRVIVTGPEGIVGGFQILWKNKMVGRIGYVSKGPVVLPAHPALTPLVNRLLVRAAKESRLTALIAQPPDETTDAAGLLQHTGFIVSNPMRVIEATYLVDVRGGMDLVRARMHRKVRQYVRKARQKGVKLRQGTEADIPCFFDLMAATCRRQKTQPNPGSAETIRRLWKIFAPTKEIEMTMAECDGEVVGAELNLIFGDRVTLWKKGWNGLHGDWHPNELLLDDTFERAQLHGYQVCDLCALGLETARQFLNGQTDEAKTVAPSDAFKLRLGGVPKILPPALVLIPNFWLRGIYRAITAGAKLRGRQRPIPRGIGSSRAPSEAQADPRCSSAGKRDST